MSDRHAARVRTVKRAVDRPLFNSMGGDVPKRDLNLGLGACPWESTAQSGGSHSFIIL